MSKGKKERRARKQGRGIKSGLK